MAAKGNNLMQRRRVAEKVRLGDVCTPLKGEQINGSELSDKFGYPFLNGGVEPSGKWRDYNVSGGTVTVSEGGNSCGFVNYMEDDFWCGAHCYYLSNPRCDSKYLFHSLKAKQKEIQALRTGVCMPNIKKSVISNFAIKYHCEVEIQRRIAAELDKICELKKNAETRLEKLDLLVKSRFVEMFGEVGSNRFPIQTIGSIAREIRYGTSRPAVEGGKYIYLRMNNVTQDGRVDLTNIKRISVPDSEVEKCIVRRGDILFNRTNSKELIGKTCMFDFDEPMIIAGYLIRVRLEDSVLPQYVSMFMNMPSMKSKLRHMAKGAVNQANISAEELKTIKIPIPPLSLQREFAAFVEKVDKLRLNIRSTVAKMDMLYRSKLQEYFG